jgi:predicted glycosyltransferase
MDCQVQALLRRSSWISHLLQEFLTIICVQEMLEIWLFQEEIVGRVRSETTVSSALAVTRRAIPLVDVGTRTGTDVGIKEAAVTPTRSSVEIVRVAGNSQR